MDNFKDFSDKVTFICSSGDFSFPQTKTAERHFIDPVEWAVMDKETRLAYRKADNAQDYKTAKAIYDKWKKEHPEVKNSYEQGQSGTKPPTGGGDGGNGPTGGDGGDGKPPKDPKPPKKDSGKKDNNKKDENKKKNEPKGPYIPGEQKTDRLSDRKMSGFQNRTTEKRTDLFEKEYDTKIKKEELATAQAEEEFNNYNSPEATRARQLKQQELDLENKRKERKLAEQADGGKLRHAAKGAIGSISDKQRETYKLSEYDSGANKGYGASTVMYGLQNRKGLTNLGMDLVSGHDPSKKSSKTLKYEKKAEEAAKLAKDENNGSTLSQKYYNWRADKNQKKAAEQQQQERAQAFMGTVSNATNAGSVALDAISSKRRERTIREGGYEELQRKQAKLAYALGDRSFATKHALGKHLGGKFNPVNWVRPMKIRNNRRNYAKSLQYGDYSEQDLNGLNLILSRDFSEDVSEESTTNVQEQTPNLSWQPEEYAKLNAILSADFESYDEQVAIEKSQANFSEEQETQSAETETPVDETVNQPSVDSEEQDIVIDYDNMDRDSLLKILNTSFYKVDDEEKRYQEAIAKGFSDEAVESERYESFLEGFSSFIDSSRVY